MPITKLGTDFISFSKEAADPLDLPRYLYRALKGVYSQASSAASRVGKITKSTSRFLYKAGPKQTIEAGIKGADKFGRWVYKNHSMGIPVLGVAATGAYVVPDRLKASIIHSDPNSEGTYSKYRSFIPGVPTPVIASPFTTIDYKNPEAREWYKNLNIYA